MEERAASDPVKISRGKKCVFLLSTVLLILLAVEVGARIIEFAAGSIRGNLREDGGFGQNNLYVEIKNPVKVFELAEQDGKSIYRRTLHHQWIDPKLKFDASKSADTIRIFCLGGSAAKGWPYQDAHTYPGFLAHKLGLLCDKRIEVINAAGFTYASHRVKFVFDEIVEYEPDLILIYSGNNEFLENFVYRPRSLGSPWSHLAVARIVHGWLVTQRQPTNIVDFENYGMADHHATRLSFAFGKASTLREDPEQFRQVQAHYQYNIESMVKEARRRNVPVMLLSVPVNLKDWIPNVSVHRPDLTPSDLDRWTVHFRAGILAIEKQDYAAAAEAFEKAVAIDDEYAEAHYYLGVAKRHLGQTSEAKGHYLKACEKDAYPFRSPPQFDAVLAEIGERHDIPLVDIRRTLEQRAGDGIPGLDVLIDYVHPTVASNESIADAVLRQMVEKGLLPTPLAASLSDIEVQIPPGIDETFHVMRSVYLQYLNMRQYDKLDRLSDKLIAAAKRVAQTKPEMAKFALHMIKRTEHIQPVVRDYRRLLRAEKLGILEQEFTSAEADAIFRRFVELIRQVEGRNIPHREFEEYIPDLVYKVRKTAVD